MGWWPEMRSLYKALVAGVMTLLFAISPASALTLVGDDGVALTLSKPATRVVTLLPSLAEVVCDLGACDRLVGIDRYTNWPPETANVAVVGGGLCGGFSAGRAGGVWGLLLGGEEGVRALPP